MPNIPVRAVITAEDRASNVLKGFGNGLDNLGGKALHLAKRMTQVGAAAIAAGTAFAVKSAADFEQSRVAFETMLGSADKARKLLKEVSDFARRTPFELPGVVEASKNLLAFGIEQEKVLPTLKALGDVAAGLGVPLERLILNYGQVRTQTRLTGVELRDFLRAGVPLISELAKNLGKTEAQIKDMVEEGKIGFNDVEKAFQTMTGSGGRFFDLMSKQSRTFSGVLANLKDNLGRIAREIVGISETGDIREGSFFARLVDAANRLLTWIDTHQAEINAFFQGLAVFIGQVAHIGRIAFELLQPAIDAVVMAFRDILLPVILNNKDEFILLAKLLGFVLIGAIGALLLIVAALGLALAGLIELSARIRDAMVGAFNAIKRAIEEVIKAYDKFVQKTTGGKTKDFLGNVKKGFNELFGGRQMGGHVSAGEPVVVGERRPELFVPSTGGRIEPRVPKGGGASVNLSVNIGMFAGSPMEKRRIAEELFKQLSDVANKKNTTVAKMIGA